MKKILCAILAGVMLQQAVVNVYAESVKTEAVQNAYESTEKAKEAQALLNGLGETDFFSVIDNNPVSRGDFIYGLIDVLGINTGLSGKSGFLDVPAGSKYEQAVETALTYSLISKGDNFRVNDTIKLNEAIKIIVGVLGYSYVAEIQGGYPYGYMNVAEERNLLNNVGIKEEITKEDMALLLYNMFMSEVADVEYKGANLSAHKAGDDILLEVLHGVYSTEGIITKNSVTSYDLSYSYTKEDLTVEVEGKAYGCETDIDKYFGMNCIVYYNEDNGIVAAYPKNNNEVKILSENVTDVEAVRLTYEEENSHREKHIRIDENYLEVYNGMTAKADINHILESSGTIRLLDNDDDNVYEVIFIENFTYVKVKNIDTIDKLIEDFHSSDNNIPLDEDSVKLSVCDSEGNAVRPADIKPKDVLQVKKSFDKSLVSIEILSDASAGRISSVTNDGEIIIDDEIYKISSYAQKYCDDVKKPGKSVNYYVGFNNEIAYIDSSLQEFVYGYLIKALYVDDAEESAVIRVFTEAGIFSDYKLANKVNYNGETKKFSVIYDDLKKTDEQLIRYKLNSDGLVMAIDTAQTVNMETVSTEDLMKEKKEENSLTKHEWTETEYIYRSNGTFGVNFNASDAIVFLVPVVDGTENVVDTQAKKDFEISTVSILNSGSRYSYFEVYDVDEYGCANVLLAYNVARNNAPYSFYSNMSNQYNYGMISDIRESASPDGDLGKTLTVFSSGKFNEYFLAEDISYRMQPDDELDKGDVVRFRLDKNRIDDIILDFNADKYSHNREFDNRSAPMGYNYADAILAYQFGKVYNYGDKTCYYSSAVDEVTGKYDFSAVNLQNSNINTTNICRFDLKTQTVRSINKEDIRSYVTYGDDADIILLKQRTANTQCIFVYGKGEE